MGSLKVDAGFPYEMLTDTLDEERWWTALRTLISFLGSMTDGPVDLRYGFVIDLHIKGKEQGKDGSVNVDSLEPVIRNGLHDGTIERSRGSNFMMRAQKHSFAILLCNDADIHFASDSLDVMIKARDSLLNEHFVVHVAGDPDAG